MSVPTTRTIGVSMHGVSLNLDCDHPKLTEHVRGLLDGFVGEPSRSPDLEVVARWLLRPIEKGTSLFSDSPEMDALGKRMQIGQDELVWVDTYRDQNLQLRFRRNGGRPVFDVVYCFNPSAKKLAKYPDFERKKFFDLLRYLVMFPIAWHLERTRGWTLIHASAVADRRGAILVAGPGGSGKTTTCIALAARTGMRVVTENLLFSDGDKIYPVPEPVRLTDQSLAILGGKLGGLKPPSVPGGFKHKTMFQIADYAASGPVWPRAIFLPRFSQAGFVEPVDPLEACELIVATNRLTLELNDYYWYSAALDLLWPKPDNAAAMLGIVQRLTQTVPCFRLGIDRQAGADAVAESILMCLDRSCEELECVER